MINIKKTVETFGYFPETLPFASSKKVVATCEYCGVDYLPTYKNYNRNKKKYSDIGLVKDCCKRCGNLKGQEAAKIRGNYESIKESAKIKKINTCLERYGVEHSFQSEEVKDKIQKTLEERYNISNAVEMRYRNK